MLSAGGVATHDGTAVASGGGIPDVKINGASKRIAQKIIDL